MRGLRGLRGLCGLRGSKYMLVDQHFTWVVIFTWVAWVKYIFAWGKIFLRESLRGSKFLLGSILGG